MARTRPLAAHLAISHGLIGLFACLTVGVVLALLLPGLYLRQREAALVTAGRSLAVEIAPVLARGDVPQPGVLDSPEAGMVMVVDAEQRVLAMSSPRGGGRGRGWGGGRGAGRGRTPETERVWQPRWSDIISGQVVQGRTSLAEQGPTFVAAVPIAGKTGVLGAVVLHARLADLRGAAGALVPPIVAASLLVAVVAVLAGGGVARRMARPLQRMLEGAERVSSGDLSLQVEPPAWQEGEALARAFNRMTASLATQEQARRQFIADASHQLRAPLTALQAQAEALLDGMVTDESTRARFLTRILEEVKSLSALAEELLDLERLEAGPHSPELGPLDVRVLLLRAAEGFSFTESVSVVADVPTDLPSTLADLSEVRQALTNLVTNALKFSPPGSAVRLEARRADHGVRISVIDQGLGLAPEHLARVWERFYRAPDDTTGGSGLGLAIAKRLIERQGGRVGAESELGRGSTFWFELPLAPPD